MSMNLSQTRSTLIVIILKCLDKECTWYLYATAFPGTNVWRIRKSTQTHSCHGIQHSGHRNVDEENQPKLILATASNTPDTATSMKSLFPPKSSPSFVQTQNLLLRPFRTISKNNTASLSTTTKPGGHENVPPKSSTVRTKELTTDRKS